MYYIFYITSYTCCFSALEAFNQHIGLDSLASASQRQTERDLDSLSVTTDDLLAFPADGSLPFVQPSPLKSRHGRALVARYRERFQSQVKGKAAARQSPHRDFRKEKHDVCTPDRSDSASSKRRLRSFKENSDTLKNYPLWLTSQKSNLSVSGISSIPSLRYPGWLKSYSLLSASTKESHGQNCNTESKASYSQTLETLEARHCVDKDLSSKFFEQNGSLDLRSDSEVGESSDCDGPDARFPVDNSFSRGTKKPFREEQLELLTLKAGRDTERSTGDLANNLGSDGSPSATDILGGERSWEEAPAAFKPPVPACCEDVENALPLPKADIIQKFLEDCLNDKNKVSKTEDLFLSVPKM
ncbi:PREDICTED: LOW QUALITY PROTEIN: lung adenoma susceptibility protein 2, partial [Mesitornis unicolor]|uniref:LOW QUALITY PROTEIN: lung adenoma susceptibility protein 2 n=1 Tax=Mesitornis unicolor TaxID=54374 RepID=UPI0005289F68